MLHKDTLLVANVGDSRAIIASEFGDKLRYSPLSSDQTPFRLDERERVKKEGARVLTIEQIEGNEPLHEDWGAEGCDIIDEVGDPPRVWNDTLEQPGCAFTRSIFPLDLPSQFSLSTYPLDFPSRLSLATHLLTHMPSFQYNAPSQHNTATHTISPHLSTLVLPTASHNTFLSSPPPLPHLTPPLLTLSPPLTPLTLPSLSTRPPPHLPFLLSSPLLSPFHPPLTPPPSPRLPTPSSHPPSSHPPLSPHLPRSLGDAMAEELGVYAEPEMLSWHLGLEDRYIIIASDGVFEFLTSQAVVDMLSNVGETPGDVVEGT